MLSLLAFATLVSYRFAPDTHAIYDVNVDFDGYLPIIGGKEGKVGIVMAVKVDGQTPDEASNPRMASEIQSFRMALNNTLMPFSTKNITDFFPRTTISVSPQGKQLKTDAPDRKLPVRLPGLDVKRFPDITYLPLEFPADGIEEGKAYHFKKPFGDADVEYEVTPTAINDDTVTLKIHLSQSYISYEDAAHNPVEAKEAAIQVSTDVAGDGTATFDRRLGLIRETKITADATGHATDLSTKAQSDRKLKTTLSIVLRK